jgi:hypothetical protein
MAARSIVAFALFAVAFKSASPQNTHGIAMPRNRIDARLVPASRYEFPNPTDCNSPSVWTGDDFYLFNSIGGQPRRSKGASLETAADMADIVPGKNTIYLEDIHAGAWLESVIRDESSGRFYGWYHAEFSLFCPQGERFYPIIGAVSSDTNGATWHNLGFVLSAQELVTCTTEHPITAGGVGDFSVIVDHNAAPAEHYAYFFFSNYTGPVEEQGVSFARMLWIDRDRPNDPLTGQSRVNKWYRGSWTAKGLGGSGTPLPDDSRKVSWQSAANNGYWGPSVHWNVDLSTYVILMNRSKGGNYETEGIYLTYNSDLANPRNWAIPKKIIDRDQGWYPQVVGDTAIHGTDKVAGRTSRYFNRGRSDWYLVLNMAPPLAKRSPE